MSEFTVWDLPFKMGVQTILPSFFRQADVVLFVYDMTRPETMDNLKLWVEKATENAKDLSTYMIVGNKMDGVNEEVQKDQEKEIK
mmetsp:Transcript_41084/g.36420  ORF Transcript_41084/g.36420 Transcript_41084/m.36420 type:complete len:85 (+) Transcript_41084:730-984(+)